DDGADDRPEEPGRLSGPVEADPLPQIGGEHRPRDAEDRGQDEAARLGIARRDQLGDDADDEADDDRAEDSHVALRVPAAQWAAGNLVASRRGLTPWASPCAPGR